MKSVLIGFVGCPSCGKSTTAAKLFARLKSVELSAELVTEYCKNWSWDKREITPYSQFYFFGKQSHAESHLFNKVKYIVTDSPTLLAAFYQWYYNGSNSLAPACKEFYKRANENGVQVINFFLPRKKDYVQEGRYQTEQQADEVAVKLKEWLDKENYPYIELDCDDEDRLQEVISEIEETTGMKIDGFSLV